jgi:TATA-binding protein-associated factor Taf7
VAFPSIIQHDIKETISAIIDAQTLAGRSEGAGIPLETAVRRLLSELGVDDVDAVMGIWQEEQEERQARADEMAARVSAPPAPADEEEDDSEEEETEEETTSEAIWNRQVTAVSDLLVELKEAMGANGHS